MTKKIQVNVRLTPDELLRIAGAARGRDAANVNQHIRALALRDASLWERRQKGADRAGKQAVDDAGGSGEATGNDEGRGADAGASRDREVEEASGDGA